VFFATELGLRPTIDERRGRFGVEPICRTLDVSASANYQRATDQRSMRAIEDERLLQRIREVYEAYEAYGYRRTWKAMLRAGEWVSWFNNDRLHGAVADLPPAEFEALYAVSADQIHAEHQ
jgi:transposase InsO family protein